MRRHLQCTDLKPLTLIGRFSLGGRLPPSAQIANRAFNALSRLNVRVDVAEHQLAAHWSILCALPEITSGTD